MKYPELSAKRLPQGEKESYQDKNIFRKYGDDQMDEPGPLGVLQKLPSNDPISIYRNQKKPWDQMNPKLTNPFRPHQDRRNQVMYGFRGRSDHLSDSADPLIRFADPIHQTIKGITDDHTKRTVAKELNHIHSLYRYPESRARYFRIQAGDLQAMDEKARKHKEFAAKLEVRIAALLEEARISHIQKQKDGLKTKQ